MRVLHEMLLRRFRESKTAIKNPPIREMKKASGFFEVPTLVVLLIRLFDWPIQRAAFPVMAMQVWAKRVPVVKQICILSGLTSRA